MKCFWVGFLSMYKSYWPGSSLSKWREWACALWETHRSNQGTRRLGPPSGNQYLWSFWLSLTNTIRSKSKYHWWWDEHCLSTKQTNLLDLIMGRWAQDPLKCPSLEQSKTNWSTLSMIIIQPHWLLRLVLIYLRSCQGANFYRKCLFVQLCK